MSSGLVSTLVHLLVTAASVFVVAKVLPGMRAKSFVSAIGFALLVAVLNAVAWHFLAPLTVTFTVLTLGIGGLLINGLIFLTADKFIDGVEISGCFTAVIASIGVTVMNWLIYLLLPGSAP